MQVSLEMIFNQIPIEKYKPFNNQCSHHIETSQLICSANQLTGFYMIGSLFVKGLIIIFFETQKQPPEVFYKRICSWKFRNIHRKTPVLASTFLIKDSNIGIFLWILQNLYKICVCRNAILRQINALFSSSFSSCTMNYNRLPMIVFKSS